MTNHKHMSSLCLVKSGFKDDYGQTTCWGKLSSETAQLCLQRVPQHSQMLSHTTYIFYLHQQFTIHHCVLYTRALCTQGQLPWLYCGCGYTSYVYACTGCPYCAPASIGRCALAVQHSISSLLTSEPKPHPTATFATLTGTQRMIVMAASIFYIQSMLSPYKILTVIWFSCEKHSYG